MLLSFLLRIVTSWIVINALSQVRFARSDNLTGSRKTPRRKESGLKSSSLTHQEMEMTLSSFGSTDNVTYTSVAECCPTIVELVEPKGAINMAGHLVELFKESGIGQRFFEQSCRADVVNKPCSFINKKFKNVSRCMQKYTYTYALVRDHSSRTDWRLDYIRVRGGCACEIVSDQNRKKKKKN